MMDGTLRQVLDDLKDDQCDGSGVKIGTSYTKRLAAEQAEQGRADAIANAPATPPPPTATPEPVNQPTVRSELRGGGDPYAVTVDPSDVASIVDRVVAGGHSNTPLTEQHSGTWA